MKCFNCGEEHFPGDLCWGNKKPGGYIGFTYDILKIPGLVHWFKKKFTKEQANDKSVKTPV